jgi:hypothetical protein
MAFRDQILCVKAEATSGTLETLAGADAIQVAQFTPTVQDFGVAERTVIGARPGVVKPAAMVERKIGFEVPFEFAGSGTAGTAGGIDKLMLMAGFNKAVVGGTSVTYSLAWPPSATTYSVGTFVDGQRYAGAGCRASQLAITAAANGFLEATATIMGLYRAPATAANPTPTFPAQADPVTFNSAGVAAGSVTLGGVALCVSEFELTVANTTVLRDHAGCTPRIEITDRAVTGSITFARPDLATLDVFANAAASTLAALVVPVGTVPGNISTFNLPAIQLGAIELVDLDGMAGLKAPFTQVAATANLELNIVQT